MNARARASIFSISLLGAIFALSTPAWAPGTLGLDEVLAAVKTEPKLLAEIERELKKDGSKADRLTCMGARHGNQWKYLGGARRPLFVRHRPTGNHDRRRPRLLRCQRPKSRGRRARFV
jgi:hypothetical protein